LASGTKSLDARYTYSHQIASPQGSVNYQAKNAETYQSPAEHQPSTTLRSQQEAL